MEFSLPKGPVIISKGKKVEIPEKEGIVTIVLLAWVANQIMSLSSHGFSWLVKIKRRFISECINDVLSQIVRQLNYWLIAQHFSLHGLLPFFASFELQRKL